MTRPGPAAIERAFPGQGKELARILRMTRAELEETPAGAARIAECYHPPGARDLRMTVFAAAAEGACGYESAPTRDGFNLYYVNVGDGYLPTLTWRRGRSGWWRYRIECPADVLTWAGE